MPQFIKYSMCGEKSRIIIKLARIVSCLFFPYWQSILIYHIIILLYQYRMLEQSSKGKFMITIMGVYCHFSGIFHIDIKVIETFFMSWFLHLPKMPTLAFWVNSSNLIPKTAFGQFGNTAFLAKWYLQVVKKCKLVNKKCHFSEQFAKKVIEKMKNDLMTLYTKNYGDNK